MSDDTGAKDEDTGRQDPPKDDAGKDGDTDEDDEDEGEDAYTPPSREDWDKAKRRRDRATKELRELRAEMAKLKAAGEQKKDADDGGATAKELERWKKVAVQQAATAALATAGFTGTAKQAARLTRLMDLDSAEPDRNGSFDFEDEADELKDEYPALFGNKEDGAKGRVPKVRTGSGRGTGGGTQDPTKRTTDALLKSAGYR